MENYDHRPEEANKCRVYIDFYKLKEPPFSITPDPEFLFLSQTHQSVMERVLYSIDSKMGFILLSGEVGTGKTTICRSIIDTLNPIAEIVYIINPSLSGRALIASILDDLSIAYDADSSKKDLIDRLNSYLLYRECNKPVVIIIDDAQTMSLDVLEDLRLLSNLETDKEKMLQMVIVGQPELEDHLSRPEMRQLRQRIFVNCRLEHLKPREVENYIDRRLFIAGSSGQVQFSPRAKRLIAKKSKGFPRVINKICDYALTAGYVDDEYVIRRAHVKRALIELGDWGFKIRFFRKIDRQTYLWMRRLVLTTTVSLAVTVPVLLLWQSVPFKSFQNYVAALFFAGQNSSTDDSNRPLYVQEETGDGYDKTHQSDTSLSHKKKHANTLSREQKHVNGVTWTPSYRPFVIQLGSVKTFEQVTRAVSSYALKGLDIHWDWVDSRKKGRWYRIFAGHFESKAEALKAKREHRLRNSLIRFNPWTVLVGQYTDSKILTTIQSLLLENKFDSLIVESAEEIDWLLTGAYATRQGAEKIVEELKKLNFSAQVVPR
ncbi:MAG: AAA family ATPase [Desulfobacterales bacterium]|jgi:general secretion pathway protein A